MEYIVTKYENQISIGSHLIIEPSQTAFFARRGRLFDEFSEGVHEVNKHNLPLLSNSLEIPTKNNSPLEAEVWIVNHLTIKDLKWGTKGSSVVKDPIYNITVRFKSYGEYSIRVVNPRQFLESVSLGAGANFREISAEKLSDRLLGTVNAKIKVVVHEVLVKNDKSILEINSLREGVQTELSETLCNELHTKGIELIDFKILDINVDKSDSSYPYLKRGTQKDKTTDKCAGENNTPNINPYLMANNMQFIPQLNESVPHSTQKILYTLYVCKIDNLINRHFSIKQLPGVYDYDDIVYMMVHTSARPINKHSLIVQTLCKHYQFISHTDQEDDQDSYISRYIYNNSWSIGDPLFLNKQSFLNPIKECLAIPPRDRKKYLDRISPTFLIWRPGCKQPCFWDELSEFRDLSGATNFEIENLKSHLSDLLKQ